MNLAIIDIGTNTLILLIAQIGPNRTIKVLHDQAIIARLGQGIHDHHHFLEEAMNRTLTALYDFQNIIKQHQCQETIVVGTAAFRKAQNAKNFVEQVKLKTNLNIQIIDGNEEARLIHLATEHDFKNLPKPILVLDIGGGSTEIIFDDGKTNHAISFPFGSVKLTEKFLHSDPPTKQEIKALNTYVKDQLETLPKSAQKPTLIATAGTPTTLYALFLNLDSYDSKKVHGQKMQIKELDNIIQRLEKLPLKERSQIPCLPAKRADVIIAGANILKTVMDFFNLDDFYVSDRGLRYGLLYDKLATISDSSDK